MIAEWGNPPKNNDMHMWTCPDCETIHLDEPLRCKICGYDNRG